MASARQVVAIFGEFDWLAEARVREICLEFDTAPARAFEEQWKVSDALHILDDLNGLRYHRTNWRELLAGE